MLSITTLWTEVQLGWNWAQELIIGQVNGSRLLPNPIPSLHIANFRFTGDHSSKLIQVSNSDGFQPSLCTFGLCLVLVREGSPEAVTPHVIDGSCFSFWVRVTPRHRVSKDPKALGTYMDVSLNYPKGTPFLNGVSFQ